VLLSMGMLTQCAKFKGTVVTVNPNPLEVHADSIKYSVKVTVPLSRASGKNLPIRANW
jgi:hypothetical protein